MTPITLVKSMALPIRIIKTKMRKSNLQKLHLPNSNIMMSFCLQLNMKLIAVAYSKFSSFKISIITVVSEN